jgi:alpha-glucosidase
MYLARIEGEPATFAARLSPLPDRIDGAKVLGHAPHSSPWRVLLVADDPGRLIESNLVFHLSDPSKIKDTSWIKPGKTTFPWWNGYILEGVDFKPGVNTATMKHYIDFCAEQGIPYHSLDGLDIAWYGGPIQPEGATDITKAAPSIDLPELLRYAKEKNVRLRLWMHWKALRPQIDEAFRTYEKWGIEGVMVDFMDRDDQEMVRFYHEIAEKAARHHLTVTLHGAYKPTGLERTWPNMLSYEAALNQEYDKWDPRGATPEHNLDIAFIRMLAGPLDYHQGGMRSVLPANYRPQDKAPSVQGTRGHQLAMYVVYQNHMSMMADYPAAFRGQAGLDFMAGVPANWDETRVLQAEMKRCLVIARRKGDAWYLGGMTAGEPRKLKLPLTFLAKGRFNAEVYLDDDAHGPNAVTRVKKTLSSADTLEVAMPPAGGFVAQFAPARP